jgi:hypothetical protein
LLSSSFASAKEEEEATEQASWLDWRIVLLLLHGRYRPLFFLPIKKGRIFLNMFPGANLQQMNFFSFSFELVVLLLEDPASEVFFFFFCETSS